MGHHQTIIVCLYCTKVNHNFIILFCFQTLTGKEIEIDIEPTDKVDRIKERVEEKEGIPPQQQRLIFSGKQMYVSKCQPFLFSAVTSSVFNLILFI